MFKNQTKPKIHVNNTERQKTNYKQQHLQQWKKAITVSTYRFIANSGFSVCSEWQLFFVLRVPISAERTQRDCTKFNTLHSPVILAVSVGLYLVQLFCITSTGEHEIVMGPWIRTANSPRAKEAGQMNLSALFKPAEGLLTMKWIPKRLM